MASIQAVAERSLATVAGTKLYGEYGLVNVVQLIPLRHEGMATQVAECILSGPGFRL